MSLFSDLYEKMRHEYSDYSAESLAAELARRKLLADDPVAWEFAGMDYNEAMMTLAFNQLIEEKQNGPDRVA